MKVWITKYALSKGIYSIDAEKTHTVNMIIGKANGYADCYHGDEWHKTSPAAITRAKEMQVKKIASLKKQLKKIKSLTFE